MVATGVLDLVGVWKILKSFEAENDSFCKFHV